MMEYAQILNVMCCGRNEMTSSGIGLLRLSRMEKKKCLISPFLAQLPGRC